MMHQVSKNFISNYQELVDFAFTLKYMMNGKPNKLRSDIPQGRHQSITNIQELIENTYSVSAEDRSEIFIGVHKDGGNTFKHIDNKNITRYNILLSKPTHGGLLNVDGIDIHLDVGDVVVFDAGVFTHFTSPVVGSKLRIILSIGYNTI